MDVGEIKKLVRLMEEAGLTELEIEDRSGKVRLVRGAARGARARSGGTREAIDEALKLESALARLRNDHLVALLHYAPTFETLAGEEPYLWPALGSDQLAVPIQRHKPDLVIHAHAHEGAPRGQLGAVPVLNVSAQVIGRPLALVDLAAGPAVSSGQA